MVSSYVIASFQDDESFKRSPSCKKLTGVVYNVPAFPIVASLRKTVYIVVIPLVDTDT